MNHLYPQSWFRILFFLIMLPTTVYLQSGTMFNQRDDQYRLLGLKRAKEAYEIAQGEYQQSVTLWEKKLISKQELDRKRAGYIDAEVNYQQSLLAVLFEKQFISVINAIKYQNKDGSRQVELTLANTSGGSAEYKKLLKTEDELFRSLQSDIIPDVYVSLLNDQNAIISRPYEFKIEQLIYGQPVKIRFQLLQDLDIITVSMLYGSGSQRTAKIYLQKDNSENRVLVQSEQFSQEAELGAEAVFDLKLEQYSGGHTRYKLDVTNLPPQITYYFTDPGNGARLSQFKFAESASSQKALLKVFMPARPVGEIRIDQPISFFVLIIPENKRDSITITHNQSWSREQLESLGIGFVQLELIPRGLGRLLIKAQQLYHRIRSDQKVQMELSILNEGSRRLDNIEIETDPPLGWKTRIDPQTLPSLEINQQESIRLELIPPDEIAPGRYEIRIKSRSLSDTKPVFGEEKTVLVEISSPTNWLGILAVSIFIITTVIGIIVFGIKLSRR